MAEHRIVVPGVVGSSPITHPIKKRVASLLSFFMEWTAGMVQISVYRSNGCCGAGAPLASPGEKLSQKWALRNPFL